MSELDSVAVAQVQVFNRFYAQRLRAATATRHVEGLADTELRVLCTLADASAASAAELRRAMDLDAGYVSRLLATLQERGLIERAPSAMDGRARRVALTDAGRALLQPLQDAEVAAIRSSLELLGAPGRHRLLAAMMQIRSLLDTPGPGAVLRAPRPGDMGWVIHKHGALYAREFGWNADFEALVADIVIRFLREHDPQTERCWIAEQDGTPVGSIFVVRHDAQNAKLRLLHVDAAARGQGIGLRLVEEAMTFARAVGYRRMVLWTNAALTDARRLFERSGFELLTEQHEQLFGMPQVSQLWARSL
jgi:DNA-binding MarR family transcriptional regulator/GNAT superfamily N-acetyltransferase